jgi:protein-L-isoaspartate(D-aspartate) O-methyltransferase
MDDLSRLRHWPPRWTDVTDPGVLAAIAEVPRHEFVPSQYRDQAYEDIPLPIGYGQTISQPYIVAVMTQALRLTPQSLVLDIGTGSGYQAAILACLASQVWSVEAVPELASAAAERLERLAYRVEVQVGDGRRGWPEHAPYDGILVAAASRDVPPALIAQLAEGGRLVIPLGASTWDQRLWLLEKRGETLNKTFLSDVRFVPLVSTEPPTDLEDSVFAGIRRKLQQLFGQN